MPARLTSGFSLRKNAFALAPRKTRHLFVRASLSLLTATSLVVQSVLQSPLVFAQEESPDILDSIVPSPDATESAALDESSEATASAELVPIPPLPLPFTGSFPVSLAFGETITDELILEDLRKLGNQNPLHDGIDFALPEGTEVLAVDEGIVTEAGQGAYGNTITVFHPWGQSVYGHLGEIQVEVNQNIEKGKKIALSGSSGVTTGPHLHFGLKPQAIGNLNHHNGYIDPAPYLGLISPDQLALTQTLEDNSKVLGTTTEIPQAIDISSNPDYLFKYKYDLVNGVTAHFWDKATNRPSFAIASEDYTKKLRFFVNETTFEAGKEPHIEGNRIEFPLIIEGIPLLLRYTIEDDQVKEEFVLSTRPSEEQLDQFGAVLSIPFEIQKLGLSVTDSDGELYLQDSKAEINWTVRKPVSTDASNITHPLSARVDWHTHLEAETLNTGTYSLEINTDYLKTAQYPVTIDPTVEVDSSSLTTATSPSTMRNIVTTSDGTIHAFVNLGTETSTCNGSSQGGLVWLYSTDSGTTWTCGDQINSNTGAFASAVVDSSDNIYIILSKTTSGAGTGQDVGYRKLTKGSGSTWTLGGSQIVLDGTASVGYTYATVALQGTTRLWLAARYFDGTNYQISTYYSSNLNASTTWEVSQTTLDTAGTSSDGHFPIIVRYGSKIAVLYSPEAGGTKGRSRSDSDGATSWDSEATVTDSVSFTTPTVSGVGDTSGRIYLAINTSTNVYHLYYDGSSWTGATVSTAAASNTFVSVMTDETNSWVFFGRTTGLVSGLSGNRTLAYRKGVSPFTTASFESVTAVVSDHDFFDKYWSYVSGAFTNDTTDAQDTESADTQVVSASGDIVYLGKTDKFDAVSWDLSTVGSCAVACAAADWEYYNGTTWTDLTLTYSSNANFTGDGEIAFTAPSDWATTAVNGEGTSYYYVRMNNGSSFSTAPVGTQFASIPQINWASTIPIPLSGSAYTIWTENAGATTKIRSTGTTVTVNPDAPTSLGPTSLVDGSYTGDTTPTPTFTLADDNSSDTVKYQIQIDDSADFGSAVVDYTSALAAQGSTSFTVGQAAGGGSYTTGSESQTLSDGSYYWRVKNIDSTSQESAYSTANSGSIAFKVDASGPSTPGTPSTTSPTADTTPTWTWTASTDSGSGLATTPYTLQWSTDSGFSSGVNSTTASSTSFTHSTALTEGTWYFRVKAADTLGNESSYSSSGSVVIDLTGPTAVSLLSPGSEAYTNNQYPEFSFSTTTDAASSVSSYSLSLVKSDCSTSCTVDLGSFNGSLEDSNRLVTLSGTTFTVKAKSSTNALSEGKWTWKVTATDAVDNTTSTSRTLYVDRTAPSVSGGIDSEGTHEGYLLTANHTPQVTGTATDNLNINKVDITYQKQHTFLGLVIGETTLFTETVSRGSSGTATSWDYSTTTSKYLDFGKYKITVKASDKAGNESETTLSVNVAPENRIRELLGKKDSQKEVSEFDITLEKLQKQTLLRREKEAQELKKLLNQISQVGGQLTKSLEAKLIALADSIDQSNQARRRQFAQLNEKLFEVRQGLAAKIKLPTFDFIDHLAQTSQRLADQVQQTPLRAFNVLEQSFRNLAVNSQNLAGDTAIRLIKINRQLIDDYEKGREQAIARTRAANEDITYLTSKFSLAANLIIREVKKPVLSTTSFIDRVKVGADTFIAIVFDNDPTMISEVTIEKVGDNYAIISWKTNHYAWGKVNYGESLSYGHEVLLPERQKYHVARLEGLEKGKKYFFEVMSHNTNYTYDAFYVLEMPQEASSN